MAAPRYQEHELALVRAEYRHTPTPILAARLGCSIPGVHRRARIAGVSRPRDPYWTPDEDALLRRHYGKQAPEPMSARHIGALLGGRRTKSGMNCRARLLMLCQHGRYRDWIPAEERALAASYGILPPSEIGRHLAGVNGGYERTANQVSSKAKRMGLDGIGNATRIHHEQRQEIDRLRREVIRLRWLVAVAQGKVAAYEVADHLGYAGPSEVRLEIDRIAAGHGRAQLRLVNGKGAAD